MSGNDDDKEEAHRKLVLLVILLPYNYCDKSRWKESFGCTTTGKRRHCVASQAVQLVPTLNVYVATSLKITAAS